MGKVKVNRIVLCLFVVLTGCNSSFLKSFDNRLTAEATELPPIEYTGTPDLPSVETTTEENVTEAPENWQTKDRLKPIRSMKSDETQPIELHSGSVFRLMMTVVTKWDDEYMEKTSASFKQLASELGVELMDFVDNSQETNVMNVTIFKLVEVLPSKDSSEKVYVTFVVSSKKEFSGEDLSNSISSRIISHGGIYEYKATIEGFVLENISREEAQDYEEVKAACDLEENSTPLPQIEKNSTSQHTGDVHAKCNREKIQRGSTSIYIMEANSECVDGVRNSIRKKSDDDDSSEANGDNLDGLPEGNQCTRNIKRSTKGVSVEDETVVVIKKRGNKVFIEI